MARVVIAPDSFKGSCTAAEAAGALAAGWREQRPHDDVRVVPLADGGEGTLDAFAMAYPAARRFTVPVCGPDDRRVDAAWLLLPDSTAVVELAQCSGLPLMASPDPLHAHTFGLGEAIRAATESGAHRLVIGLGGSASTDGGTGVLAALGARFLDAAGTELPRGGGALDRLSRVDTGELAVPPPGGVILLTDVTAALTGAAGAAAAFGPQKGARPAQVAQLDAGLRRLVTVVGGDPEQPGAGAAGGTAFGLATLWGARIEAGAATIAALVGLDDQMRDCAAVVCGEGRFDRTSLIGKVVGHVIANASTTCWVGIAAGASELAPGAGVADIVELSQLAGSVSAATADPVHWLARAGAELAAHFTARALPSKAPR